MKGTCRNNISFRLSQAAQRFHADDFPCVKPDDRLIIGLDPFVAQRAVDILYDLDPLLDRRTNAGPVANEAAAAGFLGMVKRKIGMAMHQFGIAIARTEGRPSDGRARLDHMPAATGDAADRIKNARGGCIEIGHGSGFLQDHRELVTAKPENMIGLDICPDALRDALQQIIAGLMPERVVDRLEIVEIDDHQRPDARLVTGQAAQGRIKTGAIRQFGQRVNRGPPLALDHPVMLFERNRAKMDAGADESFFARSRYSLLLEIQAEGSKDQIVCIEDRNRPAGPVAGWQNMVLIRSPAPIIRDIGNNNGFAQIGRAAAGTDIGADHGARDPLGKFSGQARRGKRKKQSAGIDPKNRTGNIRQKKLDLLT